MLLLSLLVRVGGSPSEMVMDNGYYLRGDRGVHAPFGSLVSIECYLGWGSILMLWDC